MLLAGEGRDRPAFLSESSGEVHGLLPRCCCPATDILYPRGWAQHPAATNRRYFQEDGQNPGTPSCADYSFNNQLATFLWKMNEFFSFVFSVVDIFILPKAHS